MTQQRFALAGLLALLIAGAAGAQGTGATGTAGATGRGTGDTAGATTTKPESSAVDASATKSDKMSQAGKTTQLNRGEVAFIKQAAQGGLAEVENSKLAVSKANNTQVKGFAQQLLDDHSKANDELKALAASKGIEVPDQPSMAQKAKTKLLSGADGATFDRRYAEAMAASHEDTVKLFQKASTSATDPEIKAFAAKTLPTLQHHLQMAKDLKATTGKEGSTSTSGTTRK